MSVPLIIILITLSAVVIIALLLLIFSRLYYNRSVMATLAELYLRVTEKKLTERQVREGIPFLPDKNDVPITLPRRLKKSEKIREININGVQIFDFIGEKCDTVIIYLHGAGYVRPPRKQHLYFAEKLSNATGATVKMIIYKKAPNYSYKDSYAFINEQYLQTRKIYRKVYIAGDSSGGGLALGVCQSFLDNDTIQPDGIILMSPWVDLTLNNPDIEKYRKSDPIVQVENDRIWGELWLNGLSATDYKVSPLFGKTTGLAKTLIFVGTREVLYPDNILLYNKLKENGVDASIVVGNGLNHVYPIYPIPEAKKAIERIVHFIS